MSDEPQLRQPPFSREAEEAVLGGILINSEALARIGDLLRPEDFYHGANGALYAELLRMRAEAPPGEPSRIDWLTVAERLEGTATGETWTSSELVDLQNATPSAANASAYAAIVREAAAKRELITLYTNAVASLYSERHLGAAEVAAKTRAATMHITGRADSQSGLRPMRDYVREWFAELQERYARGDVITGLASPWASVDAVTYGWQPKHLIVIAGRPGMGKTIAGWEQAAHTGALGKRAAMFSLEMGGTELVQRSVASRGRVPWDFLRSPRAWSGADDAEFWSRTTQVVTDLLANNVLIDETPRLTIGQVTARAERAHSQSPLSLVVIDHIQIMDPEQRAAQNLTDAIAAISGGLKALAKRLQIPVIALAQLNRQLTQRVEKRPVMSDLRASGSIEQDADIIVLLHREDYYKQQTEPKNHRLEWIWGKGRGVPTDQPAILRSEYDQMRLSEWSEDGLPPSHEDNPPPPRSTSWGARGSKALAKDRED